MKGKAINLLDGSANNGKGREVLRTKLESLLETCTIEIRTIPCPPPGTIFAKVLETKKDGSVDVEVVKGDWEEFCKQVNAGTGYEIVSSHLEVVNEVIEETLELRPIG